MKRRSKSFECAENSRVEGLASPGALGLVCRALSCALSMSCSLLEPNEAPFGEQDWDLMTKQTCYALRTRHIEGKFGMIGSEVPKKLWHAWQRPHMQKE